jgi:DNA-binding CsgD family transcriptional regulator
MSEWPLVGRDAAMQRLGTLLTNDGESGVVLAGAAGVGKTRVGTECLTLATTAGFATARVTATRAASGIPFGAFAPLLPPSVPTVMRSDSQQEMLQGAALAIAELGAGRPLALFVDDAHLLDGASATLVHQLALMPAVFVIVALTVGERGPDAVTALWKDGVAERLDIAPIGREDIAQLLPSVLGGPVDGATLRYLASRSAGNVLFLRHLVLGALDAGALRAEDEVWRLVAHPLPASLVDLVETRLGGLEDAARTLLETVAYGEPAGVELLSRVADVTQLEILERQNLVVITRHGRRFEVRLAHPLHGDVLRARAPMLRADAARRTLADEVEATGARRHDDLLRVAEWRLEGGGSIPTGMALAAAGRARRAGALDLAEVLSRRAMEGEDRFEAALLHGEVLDLLGRVDEAEEELRALQPSARDEPQRLALAVARIYIVGSRQARVGEALKLSERALEAVGEEGRHEVAAIHANLVMSLGDAAGALRLAEPLLDVAKGRALVEACDAAATAFTRIGRIADALDAADRGAAAHLAVGGRLPVRHPAVHVLSRAEALCAAGRLVEAERTGQEHYERWVEDEQVAGQAIAAWVLARTALAQGKAGSALRWASEHVSLQRQCGSLVLRRWALVDRAYALALAGRAADAAAALEEADGLPVLPDGRWWPNQLRARAWTAVAQGDIREAVSLLWDMARTGAERGEPLPEAEALHDLARLGEASSVDDRLAELAHTVEGALAAARAQHARALAINDARALRAVSSTFEDMGAVLLAAEAATAATAAQGRPRENREAAGDERRAAALRTRCEGAVTPGLSTGRAGASLTSRELEIAKLAAKGLSNRAIAERLKLSVRTVENQLQRVYEKLGVRGRTTLTAVLDIAQSAGA